MTDRRSATGPTRRSVLAAGGAALAALAGCAGINLGEVGSEREYDSGRLASIAATNAPTPPDAFPVTITDAMLERHRDRARELIATVPERPDIPNGVVADRLQHEREHVVEDLGDERRDDDPTATERLDHARYVRADAAELAGSYRAGTGTIDRDAIAARRATLRADWHTFTADWDYRGGDAPPAVVVHAELESLLGAARRHAEPWPTIPANPATDVFRVGEALRNLESGRAALADAGRLRTRYLADDDEPPSHRAAIAASTHRVGDRLRWDRRIDHECLDESTDELPFDRNIEDTPAEHLFYEARQHADGAYESAGHAREEGDLATATLRAARGLAALRAFEAIVDAIEAGRYGPPADAQRLADAREAAATALENAWATEPVAVSAAIAGPAFGTLAFGRRLLEESDGHRSEVDRALSRFAFARHHAAAVPAVVATVVESLNVEG